MTRVSQQEMAWQIASLLLEHNQFATLPDTEDMLRYEDGVYQGDAEAFVKAKVQENVSQTEVSKHLCEEVLGHIKRSTYVKREKFDDNPKLLVLENCILNLETLETQPHTPDYLSRVKLPVRYDPNAGCPKIRQFIREVTYPEDSDTLQEFAGYTLWKNYEAQCALLLVGDGANGKTTLILIIKGFLGLHNISSRSLQELEMNRFAKAELYRKLANVYADLSDVALKSTGTFKMLTGGDPVTAEYKFRTGFSFTNYAKLIYSCNKVPEVFEDTTAYFRRWIIITFPNRFEGKAEDKDLIKKLTTTEELAGFLNWALEGLKRLRDNGWKFSNSKSVEEVREEYIRRSSPIRAFLMDCTQNDPDGYIPKQDLYGAFAEYCRKMKLPIVTPQTFFQNLVMYVKVEQARKEIQGKRVRCFVGISLRDRSRWGVEDEIQTSGDIKMEEGVDILDRVDMSPLLASTTSTMSTPSDTLMPPEHSVTSITKPEDSLVKNQGAPVNPTPAPTQESQVKDAKDSDRISADLGVQTEKAKQALRELIKPYPDPSIAQFAFLDLAHHLLREGVAKNDDEAKGLVWKLRDEGVLVECETMRGWFTINLRGCKK